MLPSIANLLLLSFYLLIGYVTSQCQPYETNMYQTTSMFPNYKPAYSILTLLKNGLFFEINNIANGQNTDEMGIDIQFSTLLGFYHCFDNGTLHLRAAGFAYKSSNVAVLTTIDRTFLHEYYLHFNGGNNSFCTGQVSYAFYMLGTSPLDRSNYPVFSGLLGNLTCIILNGQNYTWPFTN